VRAERGELLRVLAKMDAVRLLRAFRASDVDPDMTNGAFDVVNNSEKDRLVIDARRPNTFDHRLSSWTFTMATGASLVNLELGPDEVAVIFADDLQDYFYQWLASPQRALRNVLRTEFEANEVAGLRCCASLRGQKGKIMLGLDSLGMGDCNAVEYAQQAHLRLALEHHAIQVEELLTLFGRFPRGNYWAGVIIDDHAAVAVRRGLMQQGAAHPRVDPADALANPGFTRFDIMDQAYRDVKLAKNYKKEMRAVGCHTFWGSCLDGEVGRISGPPLRIVAASVITAAIAQLGVASAVLLFTVAGLWISLMVYRRRCMCLLDLIFDAVKGRKPGDVLRLSPALRTELLLVSTLAAQFYSNLRSATDCEIGCVDASNRKRAACVAPLPQGAVRELTRYAIHRGKWTRLLSPTARYFRSLGVLDPTDELPDGDVVGESPIWNDVAETLPFRTVDVERVRGHPHINISELRALIRRETMAVQRGQRQLRLLDIGDSQVAAGALAKGRSSSPSLNAELQTSLPDVLAADLYHLSAFVPSGRNAADDPTRDRPLRAPSRSMPPWLDKLCHGDFDDLDALTASLDAGAAALHASVPNLDAAARGSGRAVSDGDHPSDTCVGNAGLSPVVSRVVDAGGAGAGEDAEQAQARRDIAAGGKVALASFPHTAFLSGADGRRTASWAPSTPGVLVISDYDKRLAKALLAAGVPWVLALSHASDGAYPSAACWSWDVLGRAIARGAFNVIIAMPSCATFSTAIAPPVRTRTHPEGRLDLPSGWRRKIGRGNALAAGLGQLLAEAAQVKVPAVVIHPRSSWLWQQAQLRAHLYKEDCYDIDVCRFGAKWRKTTRVGTTIPTLRGTPLRCCCEQPHIILRGRCQHHAASRTSVAGVLPHGLAAALAAHCAYAGGWAHAPASIPAFADAACRAADLA